jgi:hypothetical protein
MCGAVLHKLGSKVGSCLMKRHYGILVTPLFVEGEDPVELRFSGGDGLVYCDSVFEWFLKKVEKSCFLHLH